MSPTPALWSFGLVVRSVMSWNGFSPGTQRVGGKDVLPDGAWGVCRDLECRDPVCRDLKSGDSVCGDPMSGTVGRAALAEQGGGG